MKHSLQALAENTAEAVSELRESVEELREQEQQQTLSASQMRTQREYAERDVRHVFF
jgi:hypothetical protein